MSTDTPLDLDYLRDLDEAATPGPWQVDFAIGDGTHEISAAPDVLLCYSVGTDHDATLIAQVRNQLPALLSALAAVTAERDEARQFEARVWQRIQTWNDNPQTRLEAFAITHEHVAAAREQAKQAQVELAHVTRERDDAASWIPRWSRPGVMRLWGEARAGTTSTAAPKADDDEPFDCAPECRCGRGKPLPAAAPDTATVLRSGPCATANCAHCTRDDCGCSCHDVTHAAPVPAGGEDGSGTADGNREEPADIFARILAFTCPTCGALPGVACRDRATTHSHIKRQMLINTSGSEVAPC